MKEKEKAEPELFLFSILTRCRDLYSVYIFSPNHHWHKENQGITGIYGEA